jgi:hypothetical protein
LQEFKERSQEPESRSQEAVSAMGRMGEPAKRRFEVATSVQALLDKAPRASNRHFAVSPIRRGASWLLSFRVTPALDTPGW